MSYRVYVLRLRDGSLYVGSTAHSVAHRAAQHKAGGRLAGRACRRVGVRCVARRLCPCHVYPTRALAVHAEVQCAQSLRRQGYRVHQH